MYLEVISLGTLLQHL